MKITQKPILGFYLRKDIVTGGNKRYLEMLHTMAIKGWDVTVIISNTIDCEHYAFKTVPVKPILKGKIIPFSVKQIFSIIPTAIRLDNKNFISIAFGETNYLALKFLKIFTGANILFAFRSNSYKAKLNEFLVYNKKQTLKDRFNLIKMSNIEKGIVELADIIVLQTEYDRDDIISRNPKGSNKTVIVPNSINESWFNNKYRSINKSTSLKKIIFLGSYEYRKGAMFFLEAVKILHNRGITIKIDLYGGRKEAVELNNYIETNNLVGSVNVYGRVENPLSLIPEYDLMVVPSVYDSYPNVVLESIFTGTPVIASNNSGMKAILKYNELLFETGNPESIADTIEKIASDKGYYKTVKTLCSDRLNIHDFSWGDEFEKVFYKIGDI